MKKFIISSALLCLTSLGYTVEKVYEPTWDSLDRRENPKWFAKAKFGIFIHWGLYSVPSFSPRGTYSEWYWHAKDGIKRKHAAAVSRSNAVENFHNRVYGEEKEYCDFRDDFNCEMFSPDDWANVFKRSGAKYVVLTAKHHDGYCLWPSEEASKSFGQAWNSVESGPQRDLVGDLTDSVRSAGLKMGLYYSIWDWFNPYWPEKGQRNDLDDDGRRKYIREVMSPQFKDIVTRYQPSLIFSDGDWWMDDERWETKPLLSWLYNNAPNKNEVIVNDRWGKVRGKHGGYMTTEYGSGFKDPSVLWEENRGIGKSFGFNRVESYDDYNSGELLIYMLCDIVSRGGNFLLDIGPTADGRIPVIMEDRLMEIGKWLEVNGEAIYGSKRWARDCQWSEGDIVEYSKHDFHHGVPDPILEMATTPRPGQARKECYFTSKGDDVYALLTQLPDSGIFTLRDMTLNDKTRVTMLGVDGNLELKQVGDDVLVHLPRLNPSRLPCRYIYTLKISKA